MNVAIVTDSAAAIPAELAKSNHVTVVPALHALAADEAAALLERVEGEVDIAEGFVSEFGPVMVVHTGPGLLGRAWWWEPA